MPLPTHSRLTSKPLSGSNNPVRKNSRRFRRRRATYEDGLLFEDRKIEALAGINRKEARQILKPIAAKNIEDRIKISNYYRSDNTLAYDRAFFYVLRHNPTGLVVFIGRYLDPETF